MPKTMLTTGRINQKKRTRAALIAAAADLAREGKAASVAEAAERADVSRATAYRYFPTHESLAVETANAILAHDMGDVVADVDNRAIEQGGGDAKDCVNRVETLERKVSDVFWRDEEQIRLLLRSQMDLWLAMKHERNVTLRRPRRNLGPIDAALAPMRDKLSVSDYEVLSAALALITGTEAIVTLLDEAGIRDPGTIGAARRFAQRAVLAAALEGGAPIANTD